MNTKTILTLFSVIVSLAVSQAALADTNAADSNGLYYVSSQRTVVRTTGRATVYSYDKAGIKNIKIVKADVYSVNNSNTEFEVSLDTSDFPDYSDVVLRVGNHVYSRPLIGGNGKTGYKRMEFEIHNRNGAEAVAKWLSVDCHLRNPLPPKFSAQFIPAQSEFHTDDPVSVDFVMTNLDDKPFYYEQTGAAALQFAFQATFKGWRLHDKTWDNNPMHMVGGFVGLVQLAPGKVFDDQVDLKWWFDFNKPGTYKIHGSYYLSIFNKPENPAEFRA
jgi:hypothetical protein